MILEGGWYYKRVGTCQPKKCGAFCCNTAMGIAATTGDKSDKSRHGDFHEFFGFKKLIVPALKQSYYVPRLSCKFLKGNLKCGIHKTKPKTCKEFPSSPSQEYYKIAKQAGCTYSFVRVRKAKKVKKA